MKRIMSLVVAGSLTLGSVAVIGVASASAAAQTATTIKLTNPNAILGMGAATITATTSVAGTVDFTAGGDVNHGLRSGHHEFGHAVPRDVRVDPSGRGSYLVGRDVHTDGHHRLRELHGDPNRRDRRGSRAGNPHGAYLALRRHDPRLRFDRTIGAGFRRGL